MKNNNCPKGVDTPIGLKKKQYLITVYHILKEGDKVNNLLTDDYPLIVHPDLAKEIGLNEAILLQQIHSLMNERKNVIDGVSWVYNTYDGWVSQFPFWSKSTIRRTINSLEKKNLLITGNFNELKFDNTKWYTINYEELKRVSKPIP